MNLKGSFDFVLSRFSHSSKASITKNTLSSGYGVDAEIPMAELVSRRKTDVKFRLAVMTYTSFSVGQGFRNTADLTTPKGRKALELIDDFCDEWNLDDLNQKIAIDEWTAGNAFVEALGTEKKRLAGVQILPLSSFVKIKRDEFGDVLGYIQNWGGLHELEPEGIIHFGWLAEDASAWGSALGQPMARKGIGYKSMSGKTIHKPDMFSIQEMVGDVTSKMVYAGLPRWDIKIAKGKKDDVENLQSLYNKLDPLQHVIHNQDSTVQPISLDTQNRFDTFIKRMEDDMISGTMSPMIRLWSSLNFSYASSKEAVDAMLPLVRMYQRAHARFIENMIYKPLLMQENIEPKKAKVRLNWGLQEPLEIDDITKIYNVIKDPIFDNLYSPQDIIDMFAESGVKFTLPKKQAKEISSQLKAIHSLQSQHEKKIPISALSSQSEQIRELMLKNKK